MENTEDKTKKPIEIFMEMDLEPLLTVYEYLCANTRIEDFPVKKAIIGYKRGDNKNQRIGDAYECDIRFGIWKRQFKKEYMEARAIDHSIGTLEDYAFNILFERLNREKGNTLSR